MRLSCFIACFISLSVSSTAFPRHILASYDANHPLHSVGDYRTVHRFGEISLPQSNSGRIRELDLRFMPPLSDEELSSTILTLQLKRTFWDGRLRGEDERKILLRPPEASEPPSMDVMHSISVLQSEAMSHLTIGLSVHPGNLRGDALRFFTESALLWSLSKGEASLVAKYEPLDVMQTSMTACWDNWFSWQTCCFHAFGDEGSYNECFDDYMRPEDCCPWGTWKDALEHSLSCQTSSTRSIGLLRAQVDRCASGGITRRLDPLDLKDKVNQGLPPEEVPQDWLECLHISTGLGTVFHIKENTCSIGSVLYLLSVGTYHPSPLPLEDLLAEAIVSEDPKALLDASRPEIFNKSITIGFLAKECQNLGDDELGWCYGAYGCFSVGGNPGDVLSSHLCAACLWACGDFQNLMEYGWLRPAFSILMDFYNASKRLRYKAEQKVQSIRKSEDAGSTGGIKADSNGLQDRNGSQAHVFSVYPTFRRGHWIDVSCAGNEGECPSPVQRLPLDKDAHLRMLKNEIREEIYEQFKGNKRDFAFFLEGQEASFSHPPWPMDYLHYLRSHERGELNEGRHSDSSRKGSTHRASNDPTQMRDDISPVLPQSLSRFSPPPPLSERSRFLLSVALWSKQPVLLAGVKDLILQEFHFRHIIDGVLALESVAAILQEEEMGYLSSDDLIKGSFLEVPPILLMSNRMRRSASWIATFLEGEGDPVGRKVSGCCPNPQHLMWAVGSGDLPVAFLVLCVACLQKEASIDEEKGEDMSFNVEGLVGLATMVMSSEGSAYTTLLSSEELIGFFLQFRNRVLQRQAGETEDEGIGRSEKYPDIDLSSVKVLSYAETFEWLRRGKSLVRVSDGELLLMDDRFASPHKRPLQYAIDIQSVFRLSNQKLCPSVLVAATDLLSGWPDKQPWPWGLHLGEDSYWMKTRDHFLGPYKKFLPQDAILGQLANYVPRPSHMSFGRWMLEWEEVTRGRRVLVVAAQKQFFHKKGALQLSNQLWPFRHSKAVMSLPDAWLPYRTVIMGDIDHLTRDLLLLVDSLKVDLLMVTWGPSARLLAMEAGCRKSVQVIDTGNLITNARTGLEEVGAPREVIDAFPVLPLDFRLDHLAHPPQFTPKLFWKEEEGF